MASGGVNANINIAVKNLQALDRLNKNLEASAKAQQKLVTGLDRVSERLSKINNQGNVFGKIAKEASSATGSLGRLSNTLSKISRFTGGEGGAIKNILGGGMLLGGAGAVGINKVSSAFDFFRGKVGATIAPVTGVNAAIIKLGGSIAAHPQLWGAAAVAMMLFGDKILPAIGKTSVAAVKGIGQLGRAINKTSQDFALAKATAIDFNIGIINVKKQMENMVRGASLNEIRTLVNQSKNEMEGFWSMTRGAEQAAIKLAAALKAQKKEQAAIDDLLRSAQGRVRKADLPTKKEAKSAQIAYKAQQYRNKELKKVEKRVALEEKASRQQKIDIAAQEKADRRRLTRARRLKKLEQRRGLAERRGRMGENLMLGAGFPMLFGGGMGAVGGGVLGAGIQGMMGGKGFGAQILLSAIGQQVDAFVASTAKLGQAFNTLNPDIDTLVATLGIAGTEEARRIELIKETQGAQAALRAVTAEMNQKLGEKAVQNLKEFGASAQRIGNAFAVLGAKMQAALAPIMKALADIVGKPIEKGQRNKAISGVVGNDAIIKGLNQQIADLRATQGGGRGGAKRRSDQINALKGEIEDRKEVLYLLEKAKIRIENNARVEESLSKTRKLNIELLQAKIDGNYEEVKLTQEINEEIEKRLEKGMGIMEIDIKSLETNLKLEDSLEEQAKLAERIEEAWKGITEQVTGSIKDGIKGLIKGTATWADMLNNIADKFLDMALNQAFYGNIMGEMGKGSGGLFKFLGFANGGSPPVGKPSIVGEKGPELFVPSSSGKIVPNHELGGGGSVNVTVNVDASGTDVQGDDSQAKQLGTMLSAAVQAELVKQKRPGGLLAGVA